MTANSKRPKSTAPRSEFFDPRLRYSIPKAAELLHAGTSTIWARIAAGSIAVIRDGGRTYVPGSEVERLSRAP